MCLVTTRSVLGPEFDEDVKLRELFIEYNKVAEKMMGVALLLPKFLYPLVRYTSRKQDDYLKQVMFPVLKQRRQAPRTKDQINVLQDFIDAGYDDDFIVAAIKTTMWAAVMNSAAALSMLLMTSLMTLELHKKRKKNKIVSLNSTINP